MDVALALVGLFFSLWAPVALLRWAIALFQAAAR
jgi:hypothetical protein